MNPFTGIIFDFDGTLADTATVIVDAMRRTFTDMGLPVQAGEDMRRTIGMKLLLAIATSRNAESLGIILATMTSLSATPSSHYLEKPPDPNKWR